MGIVFSITALTQKVTSKLHARKAKKQPQSQSEPPQQQQPYSSTPHATSAEALREAYQNERLSVTSPPIPTQPLSTTAGHTASTTTSANMASDAEYANFLEQANRDPGEGVAKESSTEGKGGFKTKDEGVTVPTVLKKVVVDAFYTSDADEPFEVVGLRFEGKKLPDEVTFAKTIQHSDPKGAEVKILDVAEWDVNGEYKEIVDAVREAVKGGDVRVYRVEREKGGSRVEYWVLGVEGGKLVGVKALGVES